MDALTKQLADALREQAGLFPSKTLKVCYEALAAFDAAKDEPEDDALTAESMARSASRLDELRAKGAEIAELKRDITDIRDKRTQERVEEDRRWKAAQPNLKPFQDLITECGGRGGFVFARDLDAVIERLQEVGEVGSTRIKCDGCGSRPVVAAIAIAQGKIACCPDCDTFTGLERNQLSAALKATQSDLQPLHDLVKKWTKFSETYDDYYICLDELKEAIAKLQSAGAVKP